MAISPWDDSGNLYGTTSLDSTGFNGEVFELTPQSNSSWKETILFTFPAPDGAGIPCAGVTFDGSGNLYGPNLFWHWPAKAPMARFYELSPQSSGPWKFTLIHNFTASDGGSPYSRLVFDSNGNLYGTGLYTDNNPLFGEVFELIPGSDGPGPKRPFTPLPQAATALTPWERRLLMPAEISTEPPLPAA